MFNFPKTITVFTISALASLSSIAQVTYTCSGVPRGVAMASDGSVLAESLGGLTWVIFCSVNGGVNNFSAAACKSFQATLLVAQATGRSVTVWFTNTVGSCAANPPWGVTPGFYFYRLDG